MVLLRVIGECILRNEEVHKLTLKSMCPMRAFYSQRVTKKRISFDSQKNAPPFFASLSNRHTVRLFYFPVLCVDFQRLAKSEKNGDSPFATISDADPLNLRQILRLSRVRDTWIGKVITTWRRVRLSHRLDNFYKKIGVKTLGLLYPTVCRLQVPK